MTDGFALKSWVISLVNKVTKKSNKYSTDETVVGTWIDGKPIYRKVFKDAVARTGDDVTLINNALPSDRDSVIKIYGILAGGIPIPVYYGDYYISLGISNSNKFAVSTYMRGWNNVSVTVVIEYTKTTDTAS